MLEENSQRGVKLANGQLHIRNYQPSENRDGPPQGQAA